MQQVATLKTLSRLNSGASFVFFSGCHTRDVQHTTDSQYENQIARYIASAR